MANVNPVSPVLVAAPSMLFKTFLLVIVVLGSKLLWKIYFPKLKGLSAKSSWGARWQSYRRATESLTT